MKAMIKSLNFESCLIHEFNFEKFSGMSCEAVANYREQLITQKLPKLNQNSFIINSFLVTIKIS